MCQIKNYKSLLYQKDSPNSEAPNIVVSGNSINPPLNSGHSTKIGGMWNLKHEISSQKFYELLINIELKSNTDIYLKNFYNHIKMCLEAVNKLH